MLSRPLSVAATALLPALAPLLLPAPASAAGAAVVDDDASCAMTPSNRYIDKEPDGAPIGYEQGPCGCILSVDDVEAGDVTCDHVDIGGASWTAYDEDAEDADAD